MRGSALLDSAERTAEVFALTLSFLNTGDLGRLTACSCRTFSTRLFRSAAWAARKRAAGLVGHQLMKCPCEDATSFAVLPRSRIAMGTSCGPIEIVGWFAAASASHPVGIGGAVPMWSGGCLRIVHELWAHEESVDALAVLSDSDAATVLLLASASSIGQSVVIHEIVSDGPTLSSRVVAAIDAIPVVTIDALPHGDLLISCSTGAEVWSSCGGAGVEPGAWRCAYRFAPVPAQAPLVVPAGPPRIPLFGFSPLSDELVQQLSMPTARRRWPLGCLHTVELGSSTNLVVSYPVESETAWAWGLPLPNAQAAPQAPADADAEGETPAAPVLLRLAGHTKAITCLVVMYHDPTAPIVVTGSADGDVRLWDPRLGASSADVTAEAEAEAEAGAAVGVATLPPPPRNARCIAVLRAGHGAECSVRCVAPLPRDRVASSSVQSGTVVVWDSADYDRLGGGGGGGGGRSAKQQRPRCRNRLLLRVQGIGCGLSTTRGGLIISGGCVRRDSKFDFYSFPEGDPAGAGAVAIRKAFVPCLGYCYPGDLWTQLGDEVEEVLPATPGDHLDGCAPFAAPAHVRHVFAVSAEDGRVVSAREIDNETLPFDNDPCSGLTDKLWDIVTLNLDGRRATASESVEAGEKDEIIHTPLYSCLLANGGAKLEWNVFY